MCGTIFYVLSYVALLAHRPARDVIGGQESQLQCSASTPEENRSPTKLVQNGTVDVSSPTLPFRVLEAMFTKDSRKSLKKWFKNPFGDRSAASPAPSPTSSTGPRAHSSQAIAVVQPTKLEDVTHHTRASSSTATDPHAPPSNPLIADARATKDKLSSENRGGTDGESNNGKVVTATPSVPLLCQGEASSAPGSSSVIIPINKAKAIERPIPEPGDVSDRSSRPHACPKNRKSPKSQNAPQNAELTLSSAVSAGPVAPSAPSTSLGQVAPTMSTTAPGQVALALQSTSLSRSLWLDALRTLPENEQQAIQSVRTTQKTQSSMPGSIEELVHMTGKKQEECDKKSYQFHFRGEKIYLRDVAGKIVFWLNKFKAIGDVAVNFDPVHASLPWAAVRFLLQAAVGELEQMGALLVSIEKVTYLIRRCTVYEVLYGSETTPGEALQDFHRELIKLYAAILRLIALANRLRDVDANLQRLLESLQDPILRTDAKVSDCLKKIDWGQQQKILKWISEVQHGDSHYEEKEKRIQSTCEWLLRHEHYIKWNESSSSTTILVSRVIDEILTALKSNPNHEGFAFFYCSRKVTGSQKPLSVLRSFVRQLSTTIINEDSMQERLWDLYSRTDREGSSLRMDSCKCLLLELINIYPKTTLVLDALDECDSRTRSQLMEAFSYFLDNALRPVKIFISSRPDSDIKNWLETWPNVDIQATDNHDDIAKFVESKISRRKRWHKIDRQLRAEIVDTLLKRSEGMFQWASLQIDQLLKLNLEDDIRDRLGKLPTTLENTYKEIYNRIADRSERERQIADRAFQWVMSSCTPLSTKLLIQAISQDPDGDATKPVGNVDEKLLLEICQHFLVIDPRRKVWKFPHLSMREYFEKSHWKPVQTNCLVASVCLVLLLNDTDTQPILRDRVDDSDLNFYARHHWMVHVKRHEEGIDGQTEKESDQFNGACDRLSALLKRFIGSPTDSSPAYQKWHQGIKNDFNEYSRQSVGRRYPKFNILRSSPFSYSLSVRDLEPASSASFAICSFGFYTVLSDWWDKPWTENTRQKDECRSLLELAAMAGSLSVCRRLIDWGIDVNEPLQIGGYGSALAAAVYRGNKGVVELLLQCEVDVNMQLQFGKFGSALPMATADYYGGTPEMIQLLINSGAEVDMPLQFGEFGSALATAVGRHAKKEVAQCLIKSRADVNLRLRNGKYGSALVAAACSGNKEVIRLLIDSGAKVNEALQIGEYGSALAAAANRGREKVIQFLIDSGAEVNMQLRSGRYGSALAAAATCDGCTLLTRRAATGMYYPVIVQLLVDSGAKVNESLQTGEYGSALAAAAYGGKKAIVQYLVNSRAEVNMQLQSGRYGSALAAAAHKGNKEVIRLLIDSGAKANEAKINDA
ncbi:hypothetical protein RRF57_012105 [Xylaria bambusicola]|uniref:Nephrocystin 3-like N-terminal domain-containing protein n=1 Tax=Xylaria bambusicola TaxID=326684 RepID=A0AAN7UZ32_9PEZI